MINSLDEDAESVLEFSLIEKSLGLRNNSDLKSVNREETYFDDDIPWTDQRNSTDFKAQSWMPSAFASGSDEPKKQVQFLDQKWESSKQNRVGSNAHSLTGIDMNQQSQFDPWEPDQNNPFSDQVV